MFQKLETEVYIKNNCNDNNPDFYPLNTGDFWEYVEEDTATLFWQTNYFKFSYVKEIIGDTVLPNGISYKVIREGKYCNSAKEQPAYNYQRKDFNGNIFIYYKDKDTLLFKYPFDEYAYYSSPYPGKFWSIGGKHSVIGFGDTLQAIDYELLDSLDWNFNYKITLVENFGIVSITGQPEIKDERTKDFFGGIIKDSAYGYLLAKRQKIDWSEFYPLHVGDYWVYEGELGHIPFTDTKRVTRDSIMSDGQKYFLIDVSGYERIDSLGELYIWDKSINKAKIIYKFSSALGDTFSIFYFKQMAWRINDKNYSVIKRFEYPDLIYRGDYYAKGFGLTDWTTEGGWGYLKGAYINGVLYGDTTITDVQAANETTLKDFELFQNYPNPFNSSTIIKYSLPQKSFVTLKIYDVLGREIITIVNEEKDAGTYMEYFNADKLASGIYVYTIKTGANTLSKKFTVLK